MKSSSPLLLLLAACCSVSAHATIVTLGADKDTSIFSNNVNNAGGGGPGLFSGTNGSTSPVSPRRALISFDLSTIPAGATITDVQLTMTLGLVAGGGPGTATIGLFDLTQNWGEGTANSGGSIGGTGQGAAAGVGDATWNAAMFPSTLWTTAGGDHASTPSASLALSGTTVGTPYTWLSTPQLVADVQGWYNNPATNFGWDLINANEVTANSLYAFYSREATGGVSQPPALQVIYTVPEPATGSLVVVAALSLLSLRPMRRRA